MKTPGFLILLACCLNSVQGDASDLFRTPFTQLPNRTETGPYGGVASQFTRSSSLQRDGRQLDNSSDQRLSSSVTEVTLGYNFTRSFGVELDVPFIYRDYQRVRRFGDEADQTAGVGDLSLIANWTAVRIGEGEKFFGIRFSGGLKLPTGDSDRLREETEEPEEVKGLVITKPGRVELVPQYIERPISLPQPGSIPRSERVFIGNRIVVTPPKFKERVIGRVPRHILRGKDLALGSGSVDGILAANLYTRWHRFFVAADARYTIRSEGAYDYRYGDSFQWSGGPGLYAMDGPAMRVAIQFLCSGEIKREDEFQGHERDDTALTSVFVGPNIVASWRDRFSAQIGTEIPVHLDNSGLQLVPDFRLQTSLSWQF